MQGEGSLLGAARIRAFYTAHRRGCKALALAALLAAASVLFWNFPMLYAPDSDTYLVNGKALAGLLPMERYNGVRGMGLPFLLSLGFRLGGVTSGVVRAVFFVLFLMYTASLFFLVEGWGLLERPLGVLALALAAAALVCNPVIVAYSHLCLTEFPVMALLMLYLCLAFRLAGRESAAVLPRATLCAAFCAVLYAVKQVAFPLPLIVFCGMELWTLCHGWSGKRLTGLAACVLASGLCVLGYIRFQAAFVPVQTVEGASVSVYAGSFVVDGLRYFDPSDRMDYEDVIPIYVMDDLYEQPVDTMYLRMGKSLGENLQYWAACFAAYPERVLKGYLDNYSVICGVHHTIARDPEGISRAHTRVTTTNEFFNGQENEAWVAYLCQGAPEDFAARLTSPALAQGGTLDAAAYLDRFVTKLVFMDVNNRFAFFQYSFLSYYAWAFALGGLLLSYAGRRQPDRGACCQRIFICSLTVLVYVCFLSVTAQNIDRYGVTLYPLCGLLLLNQVLLAARAALWACRQWGKGARPAAR